jgi:anion-transporting  ArsA/GET3 family ATPase
VSKPARLFAAAHRLVICLGPGGVGKTTLSAALAMRGAIEGRAVDVMTVDPAPRLLDALGLDARSGEPQRVALDGVTKAAGARLRAMKLDPKATFDALVARYAHSPAARDAILDNRIYRNLSGALSGVADYMAMEKLLELLDDRASDLVVLDTPPAREALDFLDAPRRLLELLNSRALALLGASRELLRGLGLVDMAARAVLAAFDRITGLRLLSDVQGFVRSFDGMYEGFAERAQRAQAILREPETVVVVVTTAEAERVTEARAFVESLEAAGLEVDALVVNRMMPAMPALADLERAKIPADLKRRLKRNWRDFAALKRRESISLDALRARLPHRAKLILAPDLGHEPRSLADLADLARSLRRVR